MKTAEEILNKFKTEAIQANKILEDSAKVSDVDVILKSMKAYAEQAVNRCAEVAALRFIPGCIDNSEIDKQSILGVKKDLK